jgi:hypothetical protein
MPSCLAGLPVRPCRRPSIVVRFSGVHFTFNVPVHLDVSDVRFGRRQHRCGLRRRRKYGLWQMCPSNYYREQYDRRDTNDQNHHCDRIVIQQVLAMYLHDDSLKEPHSRASMTDHGQVA